jgi:prephenate dehydrogenase
MTIGLIGYGRFGSFVAPLLARRARVLVHDARRRRGQKLPAGVSWGRLADVAGQNVVLLCVPVVELRAVLRRIRPFLREGSLVIDVCAVKGAPVRWLKQLLPRGVGILGTHPFFGPDSAQDGLAGLKIVLCPVRIEGLQLSAVLMELHRKGVETVFMSPDDHDRLMAETILLSQYVGRLVGSTGGTGWPPVTKNYAHLLSIVNTVRNDTAGLFEDMVRFNPYGRKLLRELDRAHRRLLRGAGGKGKKD